MLGKDEAETWETLITAFGKSSDAMKTDWL
jgi:hypothetical protein